MKDYTLEEIYSLVGREDKTAGLTFKENSEAYHTYGRFIVVEFIYTQYEREEMDQKIKDGQPETSGKVKAKYLGLDLPDEKISQLKTEGILSSDIAEMIYYAKPPKNTYQSTETKSIPTINLTVRSLPKGGNYDLMYGLLKNMITDGIGLCPKEKCEYLAAKYFFETEDVTDEEKKEIFLENGQMREVIEWEYLSIRYHKQLLKGEELKLLLQHIKKREKRSLDLLDKYLKEAGSSLSKLVKENADQAARMWVKIEHYKERRLNVVGKFPIYLDVDGYLHIYMRHVKEMKVGKHFEHKDNFQWNEDDVFMVMERVIEEIHDEIQKHFEQKPGQRYSRYGRQSVYFEGDYYTLHIEPSGRISTFHKNRKK